MPRAGKLNDVQRRYIVCALACYDGQTEVSRQVKEKFGLDVSKQAVDYYDAETNPDLPKKWANLFWKTREEFDSAQAKVGIAQANFRLRVADRLLRRELARPNVNGAQIREWLEYAARERGGAFTNRQLVDLSPVDLRTLEDEQLEALGKGEDLRKVLKGGK